MSRPCSVPLPLSFPHPQPPSPCPPLLGIPLPLSHPGLGLGLLPSCLCWEACPDCFSYIRPASPPASLLASPPKSKTQPSPKSSHFLPEHTCSTKICPLWCCEYSSYPSASVSLSGTGRTASLSSTGALLMVPGSQTARVQRQVVSTPVMGVGSRQDWVMDGMMDGGAAGMS